MKFIKGLRWFALVELLVALSMFLALQHEWLIVGLNLVSAINVFLAGSHLARLYNGSLKIATAAGPVLLSIGFIVNGIAKRIMPSSEPELFMLVAAVGAFHGYLIFAPAAALISGCGGVLAGKPTEASRSDNST